MKNIVLMVAAISCSEIMPAGRSDFVSKQFESSVDSEGTETAGEGRKKPTETKKPSWLSRWFGRSKKNLTSTTTEGTGTRAEGVAQGRNPGGLQGGVVVDEPEQTESGRVLDHQEKLAIAKIANERGFRSWFKRKPKFDKTPQQLTEAQLKLYEKLIAKFEKDPEHSQTGYLNVSDLNFDITEADRPLILKIANSAREIALFQRKAVTGLSPLGKELMNKYLSQGGAGGRSFLLEDSVAQYEHRIEVSVEAEKLLRGLLEKEPSLTVDALRIRLTGLKSASNAELEVVARANKLLHFMGQEESPLSLMTVSLENSLERFSKKQEKASEKVATEPTEAQQTKMQQVRAKRDFDAQAAARLKKFLQQKLKEAKFSKAETEVFNKLFSLDRIKQDQAQNEKMLQARIEAIISMEKNVIEEIRQQGSVQGAKEFLEQKRQTINGNLQEIAAGKGGNNDPEIKALEKQRLSDALSVTNALLEGDLYKEVYTQKDKK